MAFYEDTVLRPDVDSLLVDHTQDNNAHGQANSTHWSLVYITLVDIMRICLQRSGCHGSKFFMD